MAKLEKVESETFQRIFTNMFISDKSLIDGIGDLILYVVDGIPNSAENSRLKTLNKIRVEIERKTSGIFVPYIPSENENFIIGIAKNPRKENLEIAPNLNARYIGNQLIPFSDSSKNSFVEILNRVKQRELNKGFYGSGRHRFFPKNYFVIEDSSTGRQYKLFRGIDYRYNITEEGFITLIIDCIAKVVSAKSLHEEIIENAYSTNFLKDEVTSKNRVFDSVGRSSKGIYFYYELAGMMVPITRFSSKPIGEQKMTSPVFYKDKEFSNVAEYLKERYSRILGQEKLIKSQSSVFTDNSICYPPQFLFRSLTVNEIPNNIKNRYFYFGTKTNSGKWTFTDSASKRNDCIMKLFKDLNFEHFALGNIALNMNRIDSNRVFRVAKPRLRFKNNDNATMKETELLIKDGFLVPPKVDKFMICSDLTSEKLVNIYDFLKRISKEKLGVGLPDNFTPVPFDLEKAQSFLGNIRDSNPDSAFILLYIPSEIRNSYADMYEICDEHKISSKSMSLNSANEIIFRKRRCDRIAFNYLASALVRSGGLPWLLSKSLNYSTYATVDVGRSKAEYWGFGIVYGDDGVYTLVEGSVISGEDIGEEQVLKVLRKSANFSEGSDTLVYLRDGSLPVSELRLLRKLGSSFDSISNIAAISYKKSVPTRLFRVDKNNRISKPLSGDFIKVDKSIFIICMAGEDEYALGTPSSSLIEIMPVKGNVEPLLVMEDLFHMCYLNWGAPTEPYSTPAPLHVLDDFLKELSMGVRRFGYPF